MNGPFIIAELSANHLGDIGRAYRLIDAAAEAGADAIKLQTWTPGTMCLSDTFEVSGETWGGMNLSKLYEEAETPWAWHLPLFEYAKRKGMIGFSSVFDLGALHFLERINCPIYKISSFELVDLPLISAVAKTGKPMIISTGMATFDEIATAWANAKTAGCNDITLLKCTSTYPADASEANLGAIRTMKSAFGCSIGVSDHTLGLAVPISATVLGAEVIEKHLALSRADGGPDATFSLEPHEFKQMVIECRNAVLATQSNHIGPARADCRELRRSTYIAKDIKAGETITAEHLTTARPALGMAPDAGLRMIGRTMARDAARGTPLTEHIIMERT